jgi:hypothetical protein
MGHGYYATRALTAAVGENRRLAWLLMKPDRIAEEIAASLFAHGFQVMADDFYTEATGGLAPAQDAKDRLRRLRATE